ncbi:hypothetical protein BGZ76_006208 [Entomortierella beljakovae]|nr:hypothetical protein BGZ76_006208 [Entomortierella beljakovae]
MTSDIPQQTDGRWLSTYSRGLCSIYPKDEEGWDYLISQHSSVFTKYHDEPKPQTIAQRRLAENIERPSSTTPSLSSSLPGVSLLTDSNVSESYIIKKPLSPGRISHAFCMIGFDCIDYLTATQEDSTPEPPKVSSNTNKTSDYPVYTSPMLEDLNDSDYFAAAVCGKRTAALERKRALSRTTSQVDVADATSNTSNNDPWFQALDRLARWDEVAYR